MAYLDVNPMILALHRTPDHFAFARGQLHHIPSGHRFKFDPTGRVTIEAQCACSHLEVQADQQTELSETFHDRQVSYWRPLEINRQFAAHFTLPLWRRILISVTGYLHRALLAQSKVKHTAEVACVPAE